jgi:hypothetical protein
MVRGKGPSTAFLRSARVCVDPLLLFQKEKREEDSHTAAHCMTMMPFIHGKKDLCKVACPFFKK